jgi:hypothetical protein
MFTHSAKSRLCACAAVVVALITINIASAQNAGTSAQQGRNCPEIHEQTVIVHPGHATRFVLHITQPEGSSISIFQYPENGLLQQVTDDSTEFVFLPAEEFSGSTGFTYRLEPPRGCGNGAKLGKVTLIGGVANGTAEGQVPVDEIDPLIAALFPLATVCGTGLVPMSFAFMATAYFARRNRRRA